MAEIKVGALGTVNGATGVTVVEDDGFDVPVALVAVTVKVYEVPLVNPDTVMGLCDPLTLMFPVDDVTV